MRSYASKCEEDKRSAKTAAFTWTSPGSLLAALLSTITSVLIKCVGEVIGIQSVSETCTSLSPPLL